MPRSYTLWSAALRFTVYALTLILSLILLAGPVWAQPGEASVFVARAIVAYQDKQYDEALMALQEALRLDPNNVDALYYSGLVYIQTARPDQAAVALEAAHRIAPNDQAIAFQLGALYFDQEKYDQAQPLLEEVFAANPRMDNLGYYVGFMRYRKKDYQGALRAFRAGTSSDPDVQQLTQFYTGLALGVLGLPAQATAELAEAVKLQPASPLTGPAERVLAVVSAAGEGNRLRAEVKFGFFYNSNVPVIPSASTDPVVTSLNQEKKSSPGELGSLQVDYSFIRSGPWEATATVALFGTYNNDLTSFNILDALGGVGGSYRNVAYGMPYQLNLQYAYDYLTLGGHLFLQRNTVVPSLTVAWNTWNLTAFQFRYQNKAYANQTSVPPTENQTGSNYMAGLVHLFRFQEDRHFIKVGYQFDWDNTRGSDYDYVGNRVLAGAQYTLPWFAIRLNLDFDVHLRNYLNVNAVFPVTAPGTVQRFDTQYTTLVGATLPLPYHFAFNVTYQNIHNNSNIAVYSYTQNVFTALMSWTY